LNGILFAERISPLKRSFLKSALKKIAVKGKTQVIPITI
jgi:peptide deformylase